MVEIWRPITYNNGIYAGRYEASNLGRIKSFAQLNPRILSTAAISRGYALVCLCSRPGQKQTLPVHIIIAHEFIGPRPEGRQVNHINANKLDNRAENLEYVTPQENINHWRRFQKISVGASDEKILEAMEMVENGAIREDAAKAVGCTLGALTDYMCGRARRRLLKRRLEALGLSSIEEYKKLTGGFFRP